MTALVDYVWIASPDGGECFRLLAASADRSRGRWRVHPVDGPALKGSHATAGAAKAALIGHDRALRRKAVAA